MQAGGGGAASCVTMNVCPAIVSVVERATSVFGLTRKETEPFPVPDAPAVIVTHESVLVAVQLQALWVFTETFPVPPPAGKF